MKVLRGWLVSTCQFGPYAVMLCSAMLLANLCLLLDYRIWLEFSFDLVAPLKSLSVTDMFVVTMYCIELCNISFSGRPCERQTPTHPIQRLLKLDMVMHYSKKRNQGEYMPFKRSFTTQSHAYIRVTVTVTICRYVRQCMTSSFRCVFWRNNFFII